ncbi:hypothetical protein N657DRAFT_1409 [Parathielavia appendiculata]|uniref:Uncharacterized protein n=1 Tax=Parathielavia appendiculata TaxID=2587402 RepID=A0AAN6Z8C9_9PEZI|nr:hypothetical protein N657DRAFT_1409 [Parathielavia appendiculata]
MLLSHRVVRQSTEACRVANMGHGYLQGVLHGQSFSKQIGRLPRRNEQLELTVECRGSLESAAYSAVSSARTFFRRRSIDARGSGLLFVWPASPKSSINVTKNLISIAIAHHFSRDPHRHRTDNFGCCRYPTASLRLSNYWLQKARWLRTTLLVWARCWIQTRLNRMTPRSVFTWPDWRCRRARELRFISLSNAANLISTIFTCRT